MAMTLERTGRSMKNLEIMAGARYLAALPAGCSIFCSLRVDLLAGNRRAAGPPIDDAVVRLQPALDHAQPPSIGPICTLRCSTTLSPVDHQHIAPALVAAERGVGHEQRVLLLCRCGTRTRTK